jgi:hypothetical protein
MSICLIATRWRQQIALIIEKTIKINSSAHTANTTLPPIIIPVGEVSTNKADIVVRLFINWLPGITTRQNVPSVARTPFTASIKFNHIKLGVQTTCIQKNRGTQMQMQA